ncbi:MAG: hypothetical protein ACRDTE_26995 [Pseudonocardiaceae bacterium]
MEITTTTGTRCLPQFGSFAVPSAVWHEQRELQVAMPTAADSLGFDAFGGRPVYRTRFHSLINSNGIDLPVTHRMRMSASEP